MYLKPVMYASISASNIDVTSGSNFALTSVQTTSVTASNVALTANSNVTLDAPRMYLRPVALASVSASNIDLTAGSNLTIRTVQATTVAASNIDLNVQNGAARLTLALDKTANLNATYFGSYTTGDTVLAVDNSNAVVRLNAATDSVEMSANADVKVTPTLNFNVATGSNITMGAAVNGFITASNNLLFSASNNTTVAASNVLTLAGKTLTTTFSALDFVADNAVTFKVNTSDQPSDPVFSIGSNSIQVRGNLIITGDISTSNIVNTTVVQKSLKVSDKIIKISNIGSGSNETAPLDGPSTNDRSGLVIDGYPTLASASMSNAYEKAILWRYGDDAAATGVTSMGTNNISKESYWEMTGGSFRLTHKKVSGSTWTDVSFGFRINENDELEIVKKFWKDTQYVYRRVARFGRIIV